MNKRGQMYILAAVLLCIAIYGVMKVTNRLEMPVETNFDFYVENFKGERSYVVDYGLLMPGSERVVGDNNLLDIFTRFGSGTGIVYAEYKGDQWTIANYLDKDIQTISCEGCEEIINIPPSSLEVAGLSFELGRKYYIKETVLSGVNKKYFTKTFNSPTINIKISGNDYKLDSEGNNKIESIIFQNVDKNYIRVVKV